METKHSNAKAGGRKHLKLNIGLIVFVGIFFYMVANGVAYFTRNHISFCEVQQGSIVDSDSFTGLILRDEAVVSADSSGYLNYFVNNGDMATKNGSVCMIEASGASNAKQDTASEFSESDYSSIREQVNSFKKKYSDADYSHVYDLEYQLNNIISRIVSRSNISSMSGDVSGKYSVMAADESGVISYTYDQMEEYTTDDLTPELLTSRSYEKTQLSAGMKVDKGSPVYKIIYSDKWQIVICPTAQQLKRLQDMKTVDLVLKRDNIKVSADINVFEKDGTSYVSFDLSNYMVRYCNDRYIDIEIVWNNYDGLKIPKSSVTSKNFYKIPIEYLQMTDGSDEKGFYIVSGEDTEFIKPTVYSQDDKYCYIDCADIREGTELKNPSSGETFTVGEVVALKGVYNINRGYALFRLINILYEYGDYCIISDKMSYGVTLYDHIILNGGDVKENQIIY